MGDWLQEYKTKLKDIESLLQECEDLLNENGVSGPRQQPEVSPVERIWLPRRYIRTANYFRQAYALPNVINDLSTRNNIAYALQLSDFFNYITNRFNIGNLSLGNSFYRTTASHIFSIIESLLYGMVATLHENCVGDGEVCKMNTKCEIYLKRPNAYNFSTLIRVLREKEIMVISDDECESMMELKNIRDRVHMWDAGSSDFHDDEFGLENYNDSILLLTRIRDSVVDSFKTYQAKQAFGCRDVLEGTS